MELGCHLRLGPEVGIDVDVHNRLQLLDLTNIQPHESAMPVRFGQERGQEGLVGVVFRTVNMAAGSVHDSRCLPFALGQKGRRDEAKKGKGGR